MLFIEGYTERSAHGKTYDDTGDVLQVINDTLCVALEVKHGLYPLDKSKEDKAAHDTNSKHRETDCCSLTLKLFRACWRLLLG